MIRTLYGLDQLGAPAAFFLAWVLGLAFGFVLERAGFGSSRRLAGIFYFRDMTVLKVMFSALVTAMLGLAFVVAAGWIELEDIYQMPSVYGAQVVGGLIFGAGFVVAGWCPGTAAVGAASGKLDAFAYLGGAVAGSILFNELYPFIQPLYNWGNSGVAHAYTALELSAASLALLITLIAIGCFWGSEYVEKRVAGTGVWFNTHFLKVFSLALGIAAVSLWIFARPAPGLSASAAPSETVLLQAVEMAEDHFEPEDLAGRLMAGEPDLLVVDVRPADEFAAFHLRGAVNVPMAELDGYLAPRKNRGIVVLYSNGMTHPAQARDSLARAGHRNVFILTDGLIGFRERCLKPVSLRREPVPPDQAAQINAWRAWFADPNAPAASPSATRADTRAELPALVSTEWLAARLGQPALKVIDVRDQKDYNGGHIPGALALNPESVRGNVAGLPSMLLPAEVLAAQFSHMGLEPSDTVVLVYSGDRLRDATLVGLAFERLDHLRYAILDGGYEKWISENRPTNTDLPALQRSNYSVPESADQFTVDAQTVLNESMRGTTILDVRPEDYFTGAKKDEARGGHIPKAVNRDFALDLAAVGSGASLKSRDELAAAYARLIPARDHPVIVHCRTGHQASQTYFLLAHVLGYTRVRWYDAGWTEWAARPELPVQTESATRP